MKAIIIIAVLSLIFTFTCCSEGVTTQLHNLPGLSNSIMLDHLEADLDGYGNKEKIVLEYIEQEYLQLRVNGDEFRIDNFWYDEADFDRKPKLNVLNTGTYKKLLLSASYKINGGTDGCYDAHIFEYKDQRIKCIWNRDEFMRTSVSYRFSDKNLVLDIGALNFISKAIPVSKKRLLDILQLQNDSNGEHNRFILRELENFNFMDYDNDGNDEILLQAPIYYDVANIYTSSLFAMLSFNDGNAGNNSNKGNGSNKSNDSNNICDGTVNYEKSFLLDRKSEKAQLVKEILFKGAIVEHEWGESLNYWIETQYNGCTEASINNNIEQLIEEGIIVRQGNSYKIK